MSSVTIDQIEKEIAEHEKKRLTPEKIGRIKEIIKSAKKYEWKPGDKGKTIYLKYKNEGARLEEDKGSFLERASNVKATLQKCVIAEDYLKQKRANESYALLGNALDQFSKYNIDLSRSYGGEFEKEKKDVGKIYEAIGKRALRGAKATLKKDIKLAKDFLELAKEAEKNHIDIRERLEKEA